MDEVSAAYWDGAARGRLVLQRCADCKLVRHYPRPVCPACRSFAHEQVEADGAGTVHSWTVAHHAFDPSIAADVPYVLLTVDMAEGVRVRGRWHGPDDLRIDRPVRLTFEQGPDGAPRPVFVPAGP